MAAEAQPLNGDQAAPEWRPPHQQHRHSTLSCCDVLAMSFGILVMQFVGFPLSVFVKGLGTILAILTTFPVSVITALVVVLDSSWLGWRRKVLGTFVISLACVCVPAIELFGLILAITISSTVIPYSCVVGLLEGHGSRDVMEVLGGATMVYCGLMGGFPASIWALHYFSLIGICEMWDFMHKPRDGRPAHDVPGTWDLLCGLLFAAIGLVFAGIPAVAIVIVKTPLMLLQILFRFTYNVLPLVCSEAGSPQARLLIFIVWLFGFVMKVPQVIAAVALIAALLLAAAVVLPAYLAAGWLWFIQRPPSGGGCSRVWRPIRDGLRAAYLVVWVADVITNVVMCWHLPKDFRTWDELGEEMKEYSRRVCDSPDGWIQERSKSTCLPKPNLLAVALRGGWSPITADALRSQGLGGEWVDPLQRCWENFFDQCREVGKEMIKKGILSREAVSDAEPFVLIGLPAVVLLRAIARSPKGSAVELADGFVVVEEQLSLASQPVRKVWDKMISAKSALEQAELRGDAMELLEGAVLVGQADPDCLPDAAAALLRRFEAMEGASRGHAVSVQTGTNDIAIDLTRLPMFKSRFDEVLEGVLEQGSCCCC